MAITHTLPLRQNSTASGSLRVALTEDTPVVQEIDDEAFPPASPDLQRARPGELLAAVKAQDVYLLEQKGQAVAYFHMDRQKPGQICLSALAVRPVLQGHGLGKLMLENFLRLIPDQRNTAVWLVTSPRNHVMLGLVLGSGFAGRWLLRDFFGPGHDRIGCQLSTVAKTEKALKSRKTITGRLSEVETELERDYVIRSVTKEDEETIFLMSPATPGEFLHFSRPAPPGEFLDSARSR